MTTRQASASKLEASNVEKHHQLSDFFSSAKLPERAPTASFYF
jgi:hypothetical protein